MILSKLHYFQQLWDLAEELGEVRRVGMDQQEISLLPVHTFQAPGDTAEGGGDKEGGDCRVCLVDFAGGDRLKTLPCCHIYHVECIDEWLKVCHLSRDARKPVFGISDQVRHKPVCAVSENGKKLEISDLGRREIVLSKWRKQRR